MKWSTTSMDLSFDKESGILTIRPPEGFAEPETIEHARENVKQYALLGDGLKGILAYMPRHYLGAEVTLYYKNNAPQVPIAMIADSFFKKMIGNFLLSLNNSTRPTRLFTSGPDALEWLKAGKHRD